MLVEIVNTLSEWVTAFATLIVDLFLSMTGIFWTATESGGTLTLLGILALMSTAVGLIYLGLRFLLQLFPGAHQL